MIAEKGYQGQPLIKTLSDAWNICFFFYLNRNNVVIFLHDNQPSLTPILFKRMSVVDYSYSRDILSDSISEGFDS